MVMKIMKLLLKGPQVVFGSYAYAKLLQKTGIPPAEIFPLKCGIKAWGGYYFARGFRLLSIARSLVRNLQTSKPVFVKSTPSKLPVEVNKIIQAHGINSSLFNGNSVIKR